jgi:hypothetical protein
MGPWYEVEVEVFIHGTLADQVSRGFEALVVDDGGELIAVAVHEARPDPAGTGAQVTYLAVAAIRLDRQGSALEDGTRLSDALMGFVLADALAANRDPYVYALVAAENHRSRRMCERVGLTADSVRPSPDYIYYSAWFERE